MEKPLSLRRRQELMSSQALSVLPCCRLVSPLFEKKEQSPDAQKYSKKKDACQTIHRAGRRAAGAQPGIVVCISDGQALYLAKFTPTQ